MLGLKQRALHRPDRHDLAVRQHRNAVADGVEGVREIVRDHEYGQPERLPSKVMISASKSPAAMGSRPEVGSSRNRIGGSSASARASATRFDHAARQF